MKYSNYPIYSGINKNFLYSEPKLKRNIYFLEILVFLLNHNDSKFYLQNIINFLHTEATRRKRKSIVVISKIY